MESLDGHRPIPRERWSEELEAHAGTTAAFLRRVGAECGGQVARTVALIAGCR